jgi:hypothetical protein
MAEVYIPETFIDIKGLLIGRGGYEPQRKGAPVPDDTGAPSVCVQIRRISLCRKVHSIAVPVPPLRRDNLPAALILDRQINMLVRIKQVSSRRFGS